jgi:hypothetical protein
MLLYEKVCIEEVSDDYETESEWTKYVASLCKVCGIEPGESHLCENER